LSIFDDYDWLEFAILPAAATIDDLTPFCRTRQRNFHDVVETLSHFYGVLPSFESDDRGLILLAPRCPGNAVSAKMDCTARVFFGTSDPLFGGAAPPRSHVSAPI
jgi:hypothetical protein